MRAPTVAELKFALGNPGPWITSDGGVSDHWPRAILTVVVLPQPVPYCGDLTKLVSTCRVHRRLAPFFKAAFAAIEAAGAWAAIRDWGGTWAWRPNRNDPARLSAHAFGSAVDLNPIEYVNGSTLRQDERITAAFMREGFVSGADFHHPDAMHYEASAELLTALGEG